jgi:hypothetical protein
MRSANSVHAECAMSRLLVEDTDLLRQAHCPVLKGPSLLPVRLWRAQQKLPRAAWLTWASHSAGSPIDTKPVALEGHESPTYLRTRASLR